MVLVQIKALIPRASGGLQGSPSCTQSIISAHLPPTRAKRPSSLLLQLQYKIGTLFSSSSGMNLGRGKQNTTLNVRVVGIKTRVVSSTIPRCWHLCLQQPISSSVETSNQPLPINSNSSTLMISLPMVHRKWSTVQRIHAISSIPV